MKGKKISTGSLKSGTEVIANRVLEAAGLDPSSDDPGGDGPDDVTEGRRGFVDITDLLPKLQEINPVHEKGTLPADTYGLAEDVPSIVVPNLLLVRSDFGKATRARSPT
jgi:uncharacterized protein